MRDIKYGIQMTIIGGLFVICLMFILFGITRIRPRELDCFFNNIFFSSQKELSNHDHSFNVGLLPYISVIFLSISYVLGIFVELISFILFKKLLQSSKKDKPKWISKISNYPEERDFSWFVKFLQIGSEELNKEYMMRVQRSVLSRSISFLMLIYGLSLAFWLIMINMPWHALIGASIFLILAILFFYLYCLCRAEYLNFQVSLQSQIDYLLSLSKPAPK